MGEPDSVPVGFPSTLWTMVHDAGHHREALERLVTRYWKPVYWYVRLTCGQDSATAMDLAQEFFLHALETGFASKADAARGRFRAILKTSLFALKSVDEAPKESALSNVASAVTLPEGSSGTRACSGSALPGSPLPLIVIALAIALVPAGRIPCPVYCPLP